LPTQPRAPRHTHTHTHTHIISTLAPTTNHIHSQVPTSASAGAAADEEGGVAALLGKLPSVKLPFLGDGDADAADVSATAADVIIDEAVGGGGVEAEGEGDTNADGVTDVGEAVEQYKQATVEAIEGAAGILEGQLAAAGADGKVGGQGCTQGAAQGLGLPGPG
jgi:hypothetical protein